MSQRCVVETVVVLTLLKDLSLMNPQLYTARIGISVENLVYILNSEY